VTPATHQDSQWQRIWFAVRSQSWTSLTMVPAGPGIDVAPISDSLAAMGRVHGERPVTLINAIGVEIANVQAVIDAINAAVSRGDRVIVAVGPVTQQPSAVAIAQATSAALLVVRLGDSQMDTAQGALLAVGREHFLGSIVLDGNSRATLR
jgi:hypothetical protein